MKVKEAGVQMKEPAPPVKKWWEEELELQAASHHPDDLEDAPGQCLLEARRDPSTRSSR
jgi:hypothetical protein